MATLTRDFYINTIEKRASAEAPDYHVDSQEVANKEHESNRDDSAKTLKSLFDGASKAESTESSSMKKLLPGKHGDASAHSALLKVASVAIKVAAADGAYTPWVKFASLSIPNYAEALMGGFEAEMAKIAAHWLDAASKAVPAVQKAMPNLNQVAAGVGKITPPPASAHSFMNTLKQRSPALVNPAGLS